MVAVKILPSFVWAVFVRIWHRPFAVVITKRAEERKRAQAEKIKAVHPRNEALTKMERMLDQRKAERRKLEAELQIGPKRGISQQRLHELSGKKVTFSQKTVGVISAGSKGHTGPRAGDGIVGERGREPSSSPARGLEERCKLLSENLAV